MSSTASFICFPRSALQGLREAAVPKKRLFRGPQDNFHEFLKKNGTEVVDFRGSGFMFATLLPFLDARRGINLMVSEHDDLAGFLSKSRESTIFFLTETHRRDFESKLAEEVPEDSLCAYFNEFNACHEPLAGVRMKEGIIAFRKSLSQIGSDKVVMLQIG